MQSGGFLGRLLGTLLKVGLPLIKSVFKTLFKTFLIPVELTGAASAADAGIHKKILQSKLTGLITSNEEMDDTMEIAKSFKEFGLFIKGVSKKIKNEAKEQKGRSLSVLLGTLGASLLENLLTNKGNKTKTLER